MPDLPPADAPLPSQLAQALDRLDALVAAFENDPSPGVRERAVMLLQAVDAVHRAGLTRLAAWLQADGAVDHDRALADPAVRLLLELYDLLPVDAAPRASGGVGFVPLSSVRGVSGLVLGHDRRGTASTEKPA